MVSVINSDNVVDKLADKQGKDGRAESRVVVTPAWYA
jgi:hypothetical protein